jgi:hypothetical protein
MNANSDYEKTNNNNNNKTNNNNKNNNNKTSITNMCIHTHHFIHYSSF